MPFHSIPIRSDPFRLLHVRSGNECGNADNPQRASSCLHSTWHQDQLETSCLLCLWSEVNLLYNFKSNQLPSISKSSNDGRQSVWPKISQELSSRHQDHLSTFELVGEKGLGSAWLSKVFTNSTGSKYLDCLSSKMAPNTWHVSGF